MAILYKPTVTVKLEGTNITPFESKNIFELDNKYERIFDIRSSSPSEEIDLTDVKNAKHLMFYSANSFNINIIKTFSIPAVAEVLHMSIDTLASASGNITINLPGEDPVVIAVLDTDTLSDIRTKIVSATYIKWVPTSGVDDDIVVFTQSEGYIGDTSTLPSFEDTGITGVLATFTLVTKGKDAITFDFPLSIPSKGGSPTLLHIDDNFVTTFKSLTVSTENENYIKVMVNLYGELITVV